ncbi:MAG: malonate transporter subunit MadM [Gammaproteobacteria bacterium]
MSSSIEEVLLANNLIVAFVFVGITVYFSYFISEKFTSGKFHGSAIAIILGLIFAYIAGLLYEGEKGVADIAILSGVGLLGGSMLRDFAIVATAYGANFQDLKSSGAEGVFSLFLGVILSFSLGALIAIFFGYTDAISITTIGAGAVTFVVGPITGSAIGAGSEVIALSVAAGLVKSILVMTMTPLVARRIGLNNPKSAMVFGGLMGTNSGVAAGLAAVDPKLVPYGAMTATFYTALGCLIVPSVLFFIVNLFY